MIRIGIAGASGYTGVELVKLISNHPRAQIEAITSNQYAGKSFAEIFPSMRGFDTLVCEPLDPEKLARRIDLIFLALPHKVSMAHAPEFIKRGIKVVDLSADFRFNNAAAYEAAYQPHTAKELMDRSIYGLCEIYRKQIQNADIIGNPGCYPTSILLPLIPLLREGKIQHQGLISDSKSGVSGAGRGVSLTTHFCETNESFTAYKVDGHRHVPEINEQLGIHGGRDISLTFVPHLVPVTRGMVSTIYGNVTPGTGRADIEAVYKKYYDNAPFVRCLAQGQFPAMSHVRHTNFCDFGFHLDEDTGRIIIVSAIDNLLKGAAGQAVQNMNIMSGFPDTEGLDFVQSPL